MPSSQQLDSIDGLLLVLDRLYDKVSHKDDIKHLKQFFSNPKFRNVARVKLELLKHDGSGHTPIVQNATEVYNKAIDELSNAESSPVIEELFDILNSHHIEGLINSHDKIAKKEYPPKRGEPVVRDMSAGGSSMKNVRIIKEQEPLGATIKMDEKNSSIVIARVLHDSIADSTGLIQSGDELHEINGQCVDGLTLDEVADMIGNHRGAVDMKLYPLGGSVAPKREMHVKVHFEYDYRDDKHIPCTELGMNLQNGDILRIVNQDDDSWWQARKTTDSDNVGSVGLVPSQKLQESREIKKRTTKDDSGKDKKKQKKKQMKKKIWSAGQDIDQNIENVVVYEEVKLMAPMRDVVRPLVLVGPPKVGRNELKRVLIAINPSLFATAIPHTSKPKEPSEVDGKEFHFLSRQVMELQIRRNKFAEYGEYKGHLFGISLDSVKSVAESGRVCIVDVRGESLAAIRIPEIKPFIAYIKPPSLEKLRETRATDKTKVDQNAHPFTEEDFRVMLEIGHEYETLYGHMFDAVVINDKLQDTIGALQRAVTDMLNKPQWVPATWVAS